MHVKETTDETEIQIELAKGKGWRLGFLWGAAAAALPLLLAPTIAQEIAPEPEPTVMTVTDAYSLACMKRVGRPQGTNIRIIPSCKIYAAPEFATR